MVYLEELTLHNFKSFKKAEIKLEKGFVCIVGPNGSGKSNVCDALLFALGESSLKRMRASNASQLLNNSVRRSNEGKAYVRAKFRLDDNKTLETTRIIKSDGKVAYKLNGKLTTRQELIEELRSIRSEITDANTITQGEINSMLNLSGKERRMLIDISAGIKEFDEKKESALKDLEKVDQKISEAKIMLNERYGFMEELEREKADAERYLELSDIIKRSNYTLLKLHEREAEEKYSQAIESSKRVNDSLNGIIEKLGIIEKEINEKSGERNKHSSELSSRNAELGQLNKRVEELNRIIAVSSAQKEANLSNINEIKKRIDALNGELRSTMEKYTTNKKKIDEIANAIKDKESLLPKSNDKGEISERYQELNALISAKNDEKSKLNIELARIDTIIGNLLEKINELEPRINALNFEFEEQNGKIKEIENEIKEKEESIKNARDEINKLKRSLNEMEEKRGAMMKEELLLRDEISRSGGSGRVEELLKHRHVAGVYGNALSLCSFDEGYEKAAYAAGGSRLNYIVVDNIEVANACIKILHESGFRASFIPINEIRIQALQKRGSDYIIDHVRYEKRFSKVFDYIFGDTSIISSIINAKGRIGSRYVTLDGDLVESSGVVTGGSIKISTNADAKMKRLLSEKEEIENKYSEFKVMLDSIIEELSSYEKEKLGLELKLRQELDASSSTKGELEASGGKIAEYRKSLSDAKAKKESLLESIKRCEAEISPMLNELSAMSLLNRAKESREHERKLNETKGAIEKLRIENATLMKENELFMERAKSIENDTMNLQGELRSIEASLNEIGESVERAMKERENLQARLESHDRASSRIYELIKELDDALARLSVEKGRLSGERLSRERERIELEGRLSQHQTRLGDIRAELASYGDLEMISKGINELERDIESSKRLLESLGNVNLKAPEMYNEKKKETEEAMEKLKVLQTEKDSVVSMIGQIESKKYNVFMETFNKVNENFKKLYSYIFDGDAKLLLENPKEIFNSALNIEATRGKEKQNTDQFSGGQKSMLMLILIFSLQMINPMSIYIFDEIDSALDKENTKKLSKLIKELSKSSQFIVVSHNDSLIVSADNAIGVMIKNNESNVVGIRIPSIMQQTNENPN